MLELIDDEFYMRTALRLAESAAGQTGINPVVGCVIVKEGRIVGMGAHLRRGSAHAEVHALNMAGADAEGSTAYVTLEPCSHFGRTPPCTDRLIAEKVARVVVACTDPNPQVAGSGMRKLREHGIEVIVGVLEAEARALNEAFHKYIGTGMPFVTLKTASTLDGKIAAKTGDSKWITGEQSRAVVHTLRHRHQAIMVGIGTALADDPQLTTRLPVPGLQPVRVVVDAQLRLPTGAKLLREDGRAIVLTTEAAASSQQASALQAAGAEVVAAGDGARVDLTLAMRRLGEREIGSLLLEGGGRLNGAMLQAGLVDKCWLFFAPKIVGGLESPGNFMFGGFDRMDEAIRLERLTVNMYGDDVCMVGYPRYERKE